MLRIVTRCRTLDEFIACYGPYTDETSIVVHIRPGAVGQPQKFAILLRDGTPVLSGEAIGEAEQSRRPAVRLEFAHLDEDSHYVHDLLLDAEFAHDPTNLWDGDSASYQNAMPVADDALSNDERLSAPETPPASSSASAAVSPVDDWAALVACVEERVPAPRREVVRRRAPRAGWHAVGRGSRLHRQLATAAGPAAAAMIGLLAGAAVWNLRGADASAAAALVGGDQAGASAPVVSEIEPAAALVAAPELRDTQPEAPEALPDTDSDTDIEAPPPAPAVEPATPMCRASITSTPSGAVVSWNGELIGRTPLAATPVVCGEATVGLERRGYRPVQQRVVARDGAEAALDLRLKRERQKLVLRSDPPGAVFTVNGRRIGPGPATAYAYAYKKARVSASKPGYRTWTSSVRVRGRTARVRAKLEPSSRPSTRKPSSKAARKRRSSTR